MGVSIYKRGKTLYVKYEVAGKIVQRSTKLEDNPYNREYLRRTIIPEIKRKIESGEIDKEVVKSRPLRWYGNKYTKSKEHLKTWHDINLRVIWWERRLGPKRPVDTIKVGEIEELLEKKAEETSWRTAKVYLSTLSGMLKIALRYEEITSNPATLVETGKHVKKTVEPFTPEEVRRILGAVDGWYQNFLALSFYTGARPGELYGLMKSDIDLERGVIHIERAVSRGEITTPKTEFSVRKVPILSPLVPYLKRQLAANPKSLYLFPGEDGGIMHGAHSTRKRWIRVLDKLGIEFRKQYTTRHTFITTMLKSGRVGLLELAQMVGHANTEMIVKNYARYIRDEHLKISRDIELFGDVSSCNH